MVSKSTDKPTIVINIQEKMDEDQLQEIFFGIEEEEIPYLIIRNEGLSGLEAAVNAAVQSKLSVGIGCSQDEIVVHHKNLKAEKYLFKISNYSSKPSRLQRVLGSNAARLVKGNIFKDSEELEVSF